MKVSDKNVSATKQNFTESYKLVLKIMRVIKWFGLGPLARTSKYLAILFACITLVAGVFVSITRFQQMEHQSPIVGKMAFGQGLFEAIFSIYCFIYFPFFANDCKTELLNAMYKLEKNTASNTKFREDFHWVQARIIVIVLYFLATYLSAFYMSITKNRLDLLIILSTQIIALACTLQIFAYYLVITNWLRNKYDNYNSMTVSICDKPYSGFEKKTDNIIKYLEISSNVVKLNNKLFGTSVFTSNCLFVYITLHMTVSIFDGRDGQDLTGNILKYMQPVPFVLYLIVLAMSCDAVEKSGRQVIKTCYLYMEELKDAANKEQLLLLARYAEHWCPIFSAAGFYDINQSCLTSIFYAIITYFVIIIQFNMVLTDD